MGIGFYKESNKGQEETFAVYSSYTDSFVYKNMTLKELLFFYMDRGSKLNNIKSEYLFRMRDLDLSKYTEKIIKTYDEAEDFNLDEYFLTGISMFLTTLKVREDQYVILDTFKEHIDTEILSKKEVVEKLRLFYLDIFSVNYLNKFVETNDQYSTKDNISCDIYCEEKIIELISIMDRLKENTF